VHGLADDSGGFYEGRFQLRQQGALHLGQAIVEGDQSAQRRIWHLALLDPAVPEGSKAIELLVTDQTNAVERGHRHAQFGARRTQAIRLKGVVVAGKPGLQSRLVFGWGQALEIGIQPLERSPERTRPLAGGKISEHQQVVIAELPRFAARSRAVQHDHRIAAVKLAHHFAEGVEFVECIFHGYGNIGHVIGRLAMAIADRLGIDSRKTPAKVWSGKGGDACLVAEPCTIQPHPRTRPTHRASPSP